MLPVVLSSLMWCAVPMWAAQPAVGSADRPSVQSLIDDLRNPRWRVREAATHALMDRGTGCYGALGLALRNARSFGVRRRIKRVVQELYVTDAAGPASAFLGIQRALPPVDPRIQGGCRGELITAVIECTAAERGGLRPRDLIVSIDGKWLTTEQPETFFVNWIARQRPGTACRLGIIRGGEGILLQEELAGIAPKQLERIEFEVVSHADDGRVPIPSAGLRVKNDPDIKDSSSRRLDLRAGDLILSLDGGLIPADRGRERFEEWVREHGRVGPRVPERPDPAENEDRPARSLRVLRGGQWLEFDIELGRRPANVVGSSRRQIKREEAKAEFPTWWRENFDPEDSVGDPTPGRSDPYWSLRPRWR